MPMLGKAVKQAVKAANRKKLAENAGKEPPRDIRNAAKAGNASKKEMAKQAAIGGAAMAGGVAGKREQSKGY